MHPIVETPHFYDAGDTPNPRFAGPGHRYPDRTFDEKDRLFDRI